MALALRALEMHGQRMWESERVVRTLSFMQRHAMTDLVLHESDLVHQVVYPREYFDPYALWSDLPSRRGENAIFNRRAYLDHVIALAREAAVRVWVNVKEIGFSDEVLAIHPEVFKHGAICPSEPFWNEYVHAKTDELFTDFGGLAGMIVSMGSQESRTSRAQNRCHCALCEREPLTAWYARLVSVMHAAATRHGKRVAVRDFAYKPADHEPLIAAMAQAPADVIFCLKAMPHDFYVTFPDNPAIVRRTRPQWIEYDVMGQFFGWGVMPCFVLEDLRARVPRWLDAGIEGAIFRIEWERINDLDALDTLNETNLVAAAALARGEDIDAVEVCRRWLASRSWDGRAAPWLAGILERTLPIVRAAAYINDFVSADNSMLPRSIQRAWWGMESRDALAVWDPSRAADLDLDRDKLARYLAEKEHALAAARALVRDVRAPAAGVDPDVHASIEAQFAFYDTWIEGLAITARVCLYARWAARPSDVTAADLEAFDAALRELERYATRAKAIAADSRIPHQVIMLVDPRRALDVLREGRQSLDAARALSSA